MKDITDIRGEASRDEPMKGIMDIDNGHPMFRCPVCGGRQIGNYYAPECYYKYCSYCGQRVNWEYNRKMIDDWYGR